MCLHDSVDGSIAPAGAKKSLSVVGAAIVSNGRVLCARRGPGRQLEGKWEFPGGKIEPHETAREALHREIEEELLCEVDVEGEVCTTRHEYDFAVITLTTFVCHLIGANPPHITEHEEIRWLLPEEMPKLDWAPADQEAVAKISGMRFVR